METYTSHFMIRNHYKVIRAIVEKDKFIESPDIYKTILEQFNLDGWDLISVTVTDTKKEVPFGEDGISWEEAVVIIDFSLWDGRYS